MPVPAISPLYDPARKLLREVMHEFIQATDWRFYIAPGPEDSIFDDAVFRYNRPSDNFWSLWHARKEIMRQHGISIHKSGGFYIAHIPLKALSVQATDEIIAGERWYF